MNSRGLIAPDLQIQNLPMLAMEGNFHGTATNLTIHSESLRSLGGVHRQGEGLSTKGTLDIFRFLHLPDHPIPQTICLSNSLEIAIMLFSWHKACWQFM